MKYDAALGPDFVLRLSWRQRNEGSLALSHFSQGWESDLLSYVDDYAGTRYGLISSTIKLFSGRGFVYTMNFSGSSTVSDQNPTSGTWAVRTATGGLVTKIEVYYRNGAKDTYETATAATLLRLTARADATGQAMTFAYDEPYTNAPRLTNVVTGDGVEFTFSYDDMAGDVYAITGVSNSVRSVSFGYSSGILTSITDAVSITSSFAYDPASAWITNIVTPYGTNIFTHWYTGSCYDTEHPLSCDGVDRSVVITEPAGTHQVYLFYDNPYRSGVHGIPNGMAGKVPTDFASSQIPSFSVGDPPVQTIDTIRDERNSHYWNRQQAALIPASILTNLNALTNIHYLVSRTRHWLHEPGEITRIRTLSWELPPSHNGVHEVQPLFYDYVGKYQGWDEMFNYSYTTFTGTEDFPAVVSQRMLDGTTRYDYYERNALGMQTKHIERWVENGAVQKRTNEFVYATGTGLAHVDNLLKVQHKGPGGTLVYGRALHSTYSDQIGRETNALGVTIFDFDSYRRLTTKETPAGLISTYLYDTNDYRLTNVVDAFKASPNNTPVRTNSYTWLDGYQRTHTDPRNFTRTFDYDDLGRLTQVTYSDASSTTETFEYSLPANTGFNNPSGSSLAILDLVTYKDRMGNKTRTLPNRNRQIDKILEPSRTVTGNFGTEHTIDYCGCGSPTSIIRGSNTGSPETNSIAYDYQGRIKRIELPNGTTSTNWYDALGRLSLQDDALSLTTNLYDNLNRLIQRSNGGGIIEGFAYDEDNRVVNSTNSSGVVVSNLYDDLDRILARTYPNGGVEQWAYSPGYADATVYTNQIGNRTTWAYDPAQRRTNEVGVGVYTNSFTYSPANDLVVLLDGRTNRTRWFYDDQGRMQIKTNQSNIRVLTNSYNANDQLTAKWTPAKGLITYTYDKVGNLTFITRPVSYYSSYTYNDFHRLITMVDVVGTTSFTYNSAGDILTENNPWSNNDTVTYSYHPDVPHLRTNLSLAQPSGSWGQGYSYDSAKRLSSVTSPAGTFGYTYSTGVGSATSASRLWKKLALFSGTSAYITNVFDSTARLTETALRNSSDTDLNKHSYLYNLDSQRTYEVLPNASTRTNFYDTIGQLIHSDSSTASEDRGYKYDASQNLVTRTNNATPQTFNVNVRNELTSFSASYDANGNLTNDSSRVFVYDDENQLIQVTSGGTVRSTFAYDGLGRLRTLSNYGWNGSTWTLNGTTRYIYDGRLVIQERNTSDTPLVSYTRGTDVSGTLEGAGGIGGMLARSHGYSAGSWSTHHAYHADSGGNISAMVGTGQAVSATYRYDPFGRMIAQSGTMAGQNLYRFSSKMFISPGDLYYYGYRFYDPNYQRWINQDPIWEKGGINLYRFGKNNPPKYIDPWGEGCKETIADIIAAIAVALNPFDPPDATQRGAKAEQEERENQGRRNPHAPVSSDPPPTRTPFDFERDPDGWVDRFRDRMRNAADAARGRALGVAGNALNLITGLVQEADTAWDGYLNNRSWWEETKEKLRNEPVLNWGGMDFPNPNYKPEC